MADLTPMMKQYFQMKKEHPDSIIFFRCGDFYEMFHQDAVTVSKELELTLTTRDKNKPPEEQTPMCGMPYHACEGYIGRLVDKGYKVAICEQLEDPSSAKGIIQRDVVRVVTPGTVTESSMLQEGRNNYLAVVYVPSSQELAETAEEMAVAFCDISTGRLYVKSNHVTREGACDFTSELARFQPREVVVSSHCIGNPWLMDFLTESLHLYATEGEGFLEHQGRKVCQVQFAPEDVPSSKGILCCLGGLFHYLVETLKTDLTFLSRITQIGQDGFMTLDMEACRHLELSETLWNREKKGSLLWVLDKTKTPMGKRLLQDWVKRPLYNLSEIKKRHYAVEEFVQDVMVQSQVKDHLKMIPDLERMMARISYGTGGGKELRAIGIGLEEVGKLKKVMALLHSEKLSVLAYEMEAEEKLSSTLLAAIHPEVPTSIREGGIIAEGFHEKVDELRHLLKNGNTMIDELAERTKEETGMRSMKVKFNKVFGYFIEIPRSQVEFVPPQWVRKQTTVNSERYISEELKKLEESILQAKDSLELLEYQLFLKLREETCEHIASIQKTAECLAEIDILQSFAYVASEQNYVKPVMVDSSELVIQEGRHPVVELLSKDGIFVPNNVDFGDSEKKCMIITGPNMAGKSTYMRQVALHVIMAQMGSFVPASSARIGLVDRVFTRIGASDDLTGGRSTFMVEMDEVAKILQEATSESLLILDEIGRGTSTYDGMAIAKAVLECCCEKIAAKTLFATHYHELTVVEEELSGVKNYNIAAKQKGDEVIFLRKILPGGADQSYGIQVAKLAGVPDDVIARAHDILEELEQGTMEKPTKTEVSETFVEECPVMYTVEEIRGQEVLATLKNLDLDDLSPKGALALIEGWKEQLKEE